MREDLIAEPEKERRYLLNVIRWFRYLGRQDIALQGHKGEDNFGQLMVLAGAKDENMRDHLNKPLGNKYTSHDIQNELLEILTHHVGKLKKLEKCFFYNGRRVYSYQQ